jgi:hypothetical protein
MNQIIRRPIPQAVAKVRNSIDTSPALTCRLRGFLRNTGPSCKRAAFPKIGLALLPGLVTKNSILPVEFANQERAKGLNARDAMFQAVVVRLRPILVTAFCAIAGIMPIAIGSGAGRKAGVRWAWPWLAA